MEQKIGGEFNMSEELITEVCRHGRIIKECEVCSQLIPNGELSSEEREAYAGETAEHKKNQMITKLGSLLHDEWRAPREIKDADGKGTGTFKERIKVLVKTESGGEEWFDEAKVPANTQEIKRQDIANTPFEILEPKWQAENQAAAEVAMAEVFRAVENGEALDDAFVEEASDAVHVKWLKRNDDWVYDPNYGNPDLAKPYEKLSEEEQEKDRAQVRKAIKIFEASK